MIEKFLSVADYRVLKDWKADPDTSNFERVNLIYGVNGSGKSTWANLLAEASEDVAWKSGLKLATRDSSGAKMQVKSHDNDLWANLRVFNRNFIETNLRFDNEEQSSANPLLILGKQSIDREQQTAKNEDRKRELVGQTTALSIALNKTVQAQEKLAKSASDQIVQELDIVKGRYAARSYKVTQVKQLLGVKLSPTDPKEVGKLLELINSAIPEKLATLAATRISSKELGAEVRELLTTSATGRLINALRQDHEKANWVQRGLGFHKANDACAFCGNTVTEDRIRELDLFFDQSVKNLQADIERIVTNVGLMINDVSETMNLLPKKSELSPDIRVDYQEELNQLKATHVQFIRHLNALKEATENKARQLFEVTEMPNEPNLVEILDFVNINKIIDAHNLLVASSGQRISDAAVKVEHTRVAAIKSQYDLYTTEILGLRETLANLEIELDKVEAALAALAQEELDATPLADSMNADLSRLLGRDELSFILLRNGIYDIQRSGEPALYLSEGEKTVISLLYFLRSLEAHDCDRANTIVVIDDPISSLDSNFVSGISAHIWSKLVGKNKCKQLFLLTHNFELFRSWSNLLDRLSDQVLRGEGITFLIQELRIRTIKNRDGVVIRQPYFLAWPTDGAVRKRIRSEYHYLFWRVANTLQECQEDPSPEKELDAATILPNVCRRMLEGFLSFKYPEKIGDFRGQVRSAIESLDEGATRTRLVNFLHQYSHNEEGDIGKAVARPESVYILVSVFELINEVDSNHYRKMLEALDVNPILNIA